MKAKKIKQISALFIAGVMTLSLTACGESNSSSSAAGSNSSSAAASDKLTIWAWDESFNIKAANEAAEIYAGINPDVTVEIVTMAQDDIVAKLNTSLSSGAYDGLPDIVLIEDYRIRGYLNAYPNDFSDMSDIASADDFAEYKTGVNTIDRKMYGIPFDSGVAAVFYRVDLVEAAGYTKADMENLTWDKYIEIGMAIKEKTGTDMLTLDLGDIGQVKMMLQSAGSWFTDAEGNVDIADNQALKDALSTYKALVDAGIVKTVSDWDQFVSAFNNGDVATVPTGCWISPSIKNAEDQSGKWAVAAFPRMAENADSVNASSLGGSGWYVLKNVGNEELAKNFLKETLASNVELMSLLAEDIDLVSTLKAASGSDHYNKGVEFYNGQEIFKDLAAWTENIPSVDYGEYTYTIEDMVAEALLSILNGADIDTTLSSYQTQIEAATGK